MARILQLLYGFICYAVGIVVLGWLMAFAAPLPGLKNVDSGIAWSTAVSAVIDLTLITVFALQHSVMARASFKRLWTRLVPPAVERSTYVLMASAALALLMWQWRPLPGVIWAVDEGAAARALRVVYWLGWGLVFASTFLIDHFRLFGLRQAWAAWRGDSDTGEGPFKQPAFYKFVRHPLYLGIIVALWATPLMSTGHLLFAAGLTAYVLAGIVFEEHDLVQRYGEVYRTYQQHVPRLVPLRHKHPR